MCRGQNCAAQCELAEYDTPEKTLRACGIHFLKMWPSGCLTTHSWHPEDLKIAPAVKTWISAHSSNIGHRSRKQRKSYEIVRHQKSFSRDFIGRKLLVYVHSEIERFNELHWAASLFPELDCMHDHVTLSSILRQNSMFRTFKTSLAATEQSKVFPKRIWIYFFQTQKFRKKSETQEFTESAFWAIAESSKIKTYWSC